MQGITRRLKTQNVKISSDVEITCNSRHGIHVIQEALCAAEAASTKTIKVDIRLKAAPLYVLTVIATDEKAGHAAFERAIMGSQEVLKSCKGNIVVRKFPNASILSNISKN